MISKVITEAIAGLIGLYQRYISPGLAPRCKYYPSCSQYTLDAIKGFGMRGLLLGLWRFIRCNPFSDGGVDYTPSKFLGKENKMEISRKNPKNQAISEVSR